jgi:hypothetical protein
MVDDGVIQHSAFFCVETESIPQDIGKPVAATTAKRVNNFLPFSVIRESRYELHHRLVE